ncbi:hypothetical protein CAPTEDRAFT_202513 [Capitella teleta]|uniref:G-protein coupled receptors family 1 profile domain-containing protein n=1 Tax=Capitella teleta TaxID=283909 RepID=R7U5L6_CAPTE|nr:hypothetical protein CAPTEDRAFT_202513 [Capitella teleta]|eukprot:ELU01269.1 hypothetical protein CAPTEDRAFT_202513 [Capitella teleta]
MDNLTHNGSLSDTTSFPQPLQIIYLCFGIPLGVVICLGNVILLTVIVDKKGPLRTSTRTLLGSLVISDILTGFLLILNASFLSLQETIREFYRARCMLWGLVLTLPTLCSFMHLSVISLERRHAVTAPAHPIGRRKAILYCIGIWSYCGVICVLGMLFLFGDGLRNVVGFCDVLSLPGFYLLVLALHIILAVVIETYAAVNVRNTLLLHQRKIQVTNTITYNNLMEDTKVAWVFFSAFALQLGPTVPFAILLAVLSAGVYVPATFIIARLCYLFAQIPGLKFVLYLRMNKELHKATVKRLGCTKKPPRLSPSHTP